ncbi:MAG: hypothetical protein FWD45_05900 [Coriobacteriia bacterium]|nr:hypothetical protein [Coriobacteriia bacterium]
MKNFYAGYFDIDIDVVEQVEFSYVITDADTEQEIFTSDIITIELLSQ